MTVPKDGLTARYKAEVPGRMFRHFGLCLRTFREISGQSASSVARKAGIGKSQLSKYELGQELPKFSSFEKILTVLELSPLAFFYGLAALERGFASEERPNGAGAEILREPSGSTGAVLRVQEEEAFRDLFAQLVHLLETTIEGRFLSRPPNGEIPRP